jgi:site-specific DNA-cytosine methylase
MEYIAFIPLIGGMAIANEQATGKKPKYVLSYDAFAKNESNLKAYWPDVEWKVLNAETNTLEDEPDYSDIDFVSSVCPCAGMSVMSSSHSADSDTNNWLYKAADYILGTIKPKVYFGENAPGLYSDNNIKVANKLREFADKYGYAFTIYKTDTRLHGIPQRRIRTFFFFWKGDHCPEMEYFDNPSVKPFEEWILDKNVGVHSNDIPEVDMDKTFPEVRWLMETRCNGTYKDYVKFFHDSFDNGKRIVDPYSYICNENLWEEYITWLKETGYGDETISKTGKKTSLDVATHRWNKVKNGLRFYSDEPVVYKGYTSAITGKNVTLTLHPKEFRMLSFREAMALMGLPEDFEVVTKNIVHITQNVPVCTAKDMTEQAIKFINGQLKMTEFKYIKQDNTHQKITHKE